MKSLHQFISLKFSMAFLVAGLTGCQTPETRVVEKDSNFESRAFSKVKYGEKADLKRAVIVDVRSRFDNELSRLPRSFHAFWKDWDLRGYTGDDLVSKKNDLQRLLSLKGIDPLTQVVVVGPGLKGEGAELLLAATLLSLGVERISLMTVDQVKDAMVSKAVPAIENVPYWEKPLVYNFNCEDSSSDPKAMAQKADITIGARGLKPSQVFNKNLKVKISSLPKRLNPQIYSDKGLWAYGLALHLKEQGQKPCVL